MESRSEYQQKKRKKKKLRFRKWVIVVFLLFFISIFAFSAYQVYVWHNDNKEIETIADDVVKDTKIKEKNLNQQKIIEKLKKYIELLKNIYKKYQDLGDINIEENIGNKLLSVSTAEEKEYYQRIHKIETEIHTELNKKKEDVL